MKRENSVTSCFVVLTFQIGENMMASQRNICFLKHRIFVGFSWMMTASIQLMTGTMDGCLILNKLGRRRVALCPRVMATQNVSIFELFFSCPTPTLLLLTPILHGLGEVTHSELLGMEGVKPYLFLWELEITVCLLHPAGCCAAISAFSHNRLVSSRSAFTVLLPSHLGHQAHLLQVSLHCLLPSHFRPSGSSLQVSLHCFVAESF